MSEVRMNLASWLNAVTRPGCYGNFGHYYILKLGVNHINIVLDTRNVISKCLLCQCSALFGFLKFTLLNCVLTRKRQTASLIDI